VGEFTRIMTAAAAIFLCSVLKLFIELIFSTIKKGHSRKRMALNKYSGNPYSYQLIAFATSSARIIWIAFFICLIVFL